MKTAVFPLSADPFHNGHLHNIAYCLGQFDRLYVAIGVHPTKNPVFSVEERVFLTKKVLSSSSLDLEKLVVEPMNGILRNYAYTKGADYIIRGCRNSADLDYEQVVANFNLDFGINTLIVPTTNHLRDLSSTLVKSIVKEAGLVHDYVHPAIKQALEERVRGYSLIGVTGNMGSGKTTFCKRFVDYARSQNIGAYHIDFDEMVRGLYAGESPMCCRVRQEILSAFGPDAYKDGQINRRVLSAIVFGDDGKRKLLADIVRIPSRVAFEEELRKHKGIVLVDAAYFTEYNMLPIVNYNMMIVHCPEEERYRRIEERDNMSREEVEKKTSCQHPYEMKKRLILQAQEKVKHGFFLEVEANGCYDFPKIASNLKEAFPLLR